MKNSEVECPKCLGAKELMEPKPTKGFEYRNCNICKGKGTVSSVLYDDYIFSLDEENYDDDYESNNDW